VKNSWTAEPGREITSHLLREVLEQYPDLPVTTQVDDARLTDFREVLEQYPDLPVTTQLDDARLTDERLHLVGVTVNFIPAEPEEFHGITLRFR
jgi:hypothetical protein